MNFLQGYFNSFFKRLILKKSWNQREYKWMHVHFKNKSSWIETHKIPDSGTQDYQSDRPLS